MRGQAGETGREQVRIETSKGDSQGKQVCRRRRTLKKKINEEIEHCVRSSDQVEGDGMEGAEVAKTKLKRKTKTHQVQKSVKSVQKTETDRGESTDE